MSRLVVYLTRNITYNDQNYVMSKHAVLELYDEIIKLYVKLII